MGVSVKADGGLKSLPPTSPQIAEQSTNNIALAVKSNGSASKSVREGNNGEADFARAPLSRRRQRFFSFLDGREMFSITTYSASGSPRNPWR